jgi:hypothetical protein
MNIYLSTKLTDPPKGVGVGEGGGSHLAGIEFNVPVLWTKKALPSSL